MATRASTRTRPTATATRERGGGIVKAKRDSIAQGPTGTTLTFADRIKNFTCKNVGSNPIRINFDGQALGQYWELAPGEILPVTIKIAQETTILCRGITGTSTLESLIWG